MNIYHQLRGWFLGLRLTCLGKGESAGPAFFQGYVRAPVVVRVMSVGVRDRFRFKGSREESAQCPAVQSFRERRLVHSALRTDVRYQCLTVHKDFVLHTDTGLTGDMIAHAQTAPDVRPYRWPLLWNQASAYQRRPYPVTPPRLSSVPCGFRTRWFCKPSVPKPPFSISLSSVLSFAELLSCCFLHQKMASSLLSPPLGLYVPLHSP